MEKEVANLGCPTGIFGVIQRLSAGNSAEDLGGRGSVRAGRPGSVAVHSANLIWLFVLVENLNSEPTRSIKVERPRSMLS